MGGGSYYSQNSGTLHFGLGDVTAVDEITVQWPSGTVQQIAKPAMDGTLKLKEQ